MNQQRKYKNGDHVTCIAKYSSCIPTKTSYGISNKEMRKIPEGPFIFDSYESKQNDEFCFIRPVNDSIHRMVKISEINHAMMNAKVISINDNSYLYTFDDKLKAKDYCLFYGNLTEVLEIQNPKSPYKEQLATILTHSQVTSKELETIKEFNPKSTLKIGDWTTMNHGFGCVNMPKIIATSNKKIKIPRIPKNLDGDFKAQLIWNDYNKKFQLKLDKNNQIIFL